jgi:preprotein translocase subunit YajC
MNELALIAQASPAQAQPPGWSMLVLFALLIGVMWVFFVLPAKKKQKEHEAMLSKLVGGDRVVTSGGLVGTVVKAEPTSLRLRLAPSVEVTVMRSHIIGRAPEDVS